jgi:hypothetical protein
MLKETSTNYFIIGNLTFTKDEIKSLPDQYIYNIEVDFPTLFKRHPGEKFVKFVGCSLQYMSYNGPEEYFEETVYNPLHTTLHSNLVTNENTESKIDMLQLKTDPTKPKLAHINEYTDYILTVNNFFNQKVFKISNQINKLKFHFIDENGEKVKILQIYHYDDEQDNPEYATWLSEDINTRGEKPDEKINVPCIYYFQALYNIEMELIKGYN